MPDPLPPSPPAPPIPRTVRSAAQIAGVQAVALGVGSVLYGAQGLGRPAGEQSGGEGAAVLGVATAVILGLVAWGLLRRRRQHRRRARTPALVLETLALPTGLGLLQAGQGWIAVALLVPAVVTIALLLSPSARATFDPS